MTLWKLTLAYDGTSYRGWQVQPGLPTIQGALSDAIHHVTGERVLPQGSGRTDTGVHALAQVASCALAAPIPPANFHRALNRCLPPSIRILTVEPAPPNFHARHSALRKTYEYRIFPLHPDRICPPILAPYVWPCPWPLDLAALNDAATHILGSHDFTSFAASDPDLSTRSDPEEQTPPPSAPSITHNGAPTEASSSIPSPAPGSSTTWCATSSAPSSNPARTASTPTRSPRSSPRATATPPAPLPPPPASFWSASTILQPATRNLYPATPYDRSHPVPHRTSRSQPGAAPRLSLAPSAPAPASPVAARDAAHPRAALRRRGARRVVPRSLPAARPGQPAHRRGRQRAGRASGGHINNWPRYPPLGPPRHRLPRRHADRTHGGRHPYPGSRRLRQRRGALRAAGTGRGVARLRPRPCGADPLRRQRRRRGRRRPSRHEVPLHPQPLRLAHRCRHRARRRRHQRGRHPGACEPPLPRHRRRPGGHSWTDAGAPNPILILARALLALESLDLPHAAPRTTLNVGHIAGGTSINSIPASATALLDLRSTSSSQLQAAEVALRETLDQWVTHSPATNGAASNHTPTLSVELIGDRPGGVLPDDSPLLISLRAVDRHLSLRTEPGLGSTDANIPLSLGVPAIAIGAGGVGGGIHTLQEWYDPSHRNVALRRVLLTLLDTAKLAAETTES